MYESLKKYVHSEVGGGDLRINKQKQKQGTGQI